MGASSQQRQQWGLRGRGLERRRDTAGRRGSTRWMCLLDCGPQRDGAGELLPSPALFAEAPDRRLAKGGGMREFTTRFSTSCASVRMRFKEMTPFCFRVLEPSAPTTLTSWGRHPVRTPTTVASHDSRTPVSGGRASSGSAVDGRGETPSPLPSRGGVRMDADDRR